ncbi:hypothetical protein BpHYR1_048620 [Brachionus plicatilis]|uniref:Uncharacterized protein n=1 Tax=Brachionus plicatilis TaxID=10195 RepID=A0A3M7RLT5_BRAPC|nr:hypothetical protein BpHYR1_048620 [Brachionus plicatilis]
MRYSSTRHSGFFMCALKKKRQLKYKKFKHNLKQKLTIVSGQEILNNTNEKALKPLELIIIKKKILSAFTTAFKF